MPHRHAPAHQAAVPSSAGLADALFSTTQLRVLGLLFGQPHRSFYANELITATGSGSGAVQRELARLAQSGLVTTKLFGRQKHYQANPASPLFSELCSIAAKTVALAEPLRRALGASAAHIAAAFVFGSIAKKSDSANSDIDLMVISDALTYADVFGALEEVGQQLGREVKPTIFSREEWRDRLARRDGFVRRVMEQPRIWLIGNDDALAEP